MILHVSDSGLSFLRFTSLPSPVYGLSPPGYNNEIDVLYVLLPRCKIKPENVYYKAKAACSLGVLLERTLRNGKVHHHRGRPRLLIPRTKSFQISLPSTNIVA